MVKQLIVAAMLLLLHDVSKSIQCARAILDFTILASYVSHNEETLRYIKYALYRLEKTKIAFEQYWLIDFKLYWLTFNYPKFYAINHFVQYIWNYGSAINYNTTYGKTHINIFLKLL